MFATSQSLWLSLVGGLQVVLVCAYVIVAIVALGRFLGVAAGLTRVIDAKPEA